MPTVWYQGVVTDIIIHNDSIRRFFLQVKGDDGFTWRPGQFLTFDLPVGEKRLHRWKSYSIANTPNAEGLIELCIVRHADGLGTSYLFEETAVGTELIFKGPEGNFVLPEELDKKGWSWYAPVRAWPRSEV
ncbi:MAG: hypothetical protein IPN29_04065 [Saprospiraceae bacterium]|nr:hypothetical protein [Saprospiraceae bacterium]